ncbi:MAG: TrkA family potassium uptake protein [Austwickia sp.]|nr:TrkA family potassium uptake protein [Austwickia sp.]MBK8435538.1 TrkA family potassium uptake protein [Austwickia sp.]MBK9100890.1 TrkA family potassium uptake protein [Austwickia sp.]
MHFVIMGCGRVGSTLALSLEEQGHDVAVVDKERTSFRRLGQSFEGRRVVGYGFDRDTLVQAGIEHAHAFAAVSSGDNSNILAARVARETYNIENVVARIYDPGRAEIYQRLGIPTVGTVRWTANRMLRRLLPHGATPQYTDPSGNVVIAEVAYHPGWIGRPYPDVETHTRCRIAFVMRTGQGIIPGPDAMVQEGDILNLIAASTALGAVERILEKPPPAE